jgi:tryptophanyl-tRNA synthetase
LKCATAIANYLMPFKDKREYYESRPNEVLDVLRDGEKRAQKVAMATMEDVHQAMSLG